MRVNQKGRKQASTYKYSKLLLTLYITLVLFSTPSMAYGDVAQSLDANQLDQGWSAFRRRDYVRAEQIFLSILKGNTADRTAVLEKLAAVYFTTDLAPQTIRDKIEGFCSNSDELFLFQQLMMRHGTHQPWSSEARKLLKQPEPNPLPPTDEGQTSQVDTGRRRVRPDFQEPGNKYESRVRSKIARMIEENFAVMHHAAGTHVSHGIPDVRTIGSNRYEVKLPVTISTDSGSTAHETYIWQYAVNSETGSIIKTFSDSEDRQIFLSNPDGEPQKRRRY